MNLGDRIRLARKRRGLTQRDVARHYGISREAVQQWEAGRVNPRGERVRALALLLQVSVEWLMTGADEHRPTADEARLLTLFRGLSERDQQVVLALAQSMKARAPEAEAPFPAEGAERALP